MGYTGEKKREYQRNLLRRRRQEWIDWQGGCCAKCGSVDRLEVDHIDPALKATNPSKLWSRTRAVRDAELIKCQVLCHDCHLDKTYAGVGLKHGTITGYRHYKCRCQDCRDAHAIEVRQQRASKRLRESEAA